MKREIITITITDEGAIIAPENLSQVRMTFVEIAELFGIYYQTAKRHIRAIEQAGVAEGDYSMTCMADIHGVHPEYYGLEMITAVAFRVSTRNAEIFRRWLMERAMQPNHRPLPPISVFIPERENGLPN